MALKRAQKVDELGGEDLLGRNRGRSNQAPTPISERPISRGQRILD